MKIKPVIGVIVISVLVGVGIFLMTKDSKEVKLFSNQVLREVPKEVGEGMSDESWYPSTAPRPTLPPLNKDSNLVEETEKLEPKDYSEDFKVLRSQI